MGLRVIGYELVDRVVSKHTLRKRVMKTGEMEAGPGSKLFRPIYEDLGPCTPRTLAENRFSVRRSKEF